MMVCSLEATFALFKTYHSLQRYLVYVCIHMAEVYALLPEGCVYVRTMIMVRILEGTYLGLCCILVGLSIHKNVSSIIARKEEIRSCSSAYASSIWQSILSSPSFSLRSSFVDSHAVTILLVGQFAKFHSRFLCLSIQSS